MPITLFYRFDITFADATIATPEKGDAIDRFYQITESPQHGWVVAENGRPVVIADAQHAQLAQLLAALPPFPDPAIEPVDSGADGTWITLVIRRGDQQHSYRWWSFAPANWDKLAAVAGFVQQLAEAPRQQAAERQRQIMRRFFDALSARDLAEMLALYQSDIHYSSPFFELRGAHVGALWRMRWSYLSDLRVVCTNSDIRGGSVYWQASYTYPPTGRYVEQHLTADFTFVDESIVRHVDRFNVHEWAQQAYGRIGWALGGSRVFAGWAAAMARRRLAPFLQAR